MGSLHLKSVAKRFGATHVLHDVCLDVEDGEFVVFVGPSGCGKSTLLRTIAGLETASSGDVLIDGRRVNDLPPAQRGIAMVFQTYALYPHMTVRQNMTAGLRQMRTPRATIDAQLASAARMLALEPYLDRYPAQLSGGQRQRVAIGRALVRKPSLFLFDEPLSNLDAALRVNTRLEIARLHRELQATMIYVTHDQVEAMTLADRIVVMNGGRIEQIGKPIELYQAPANRFVAGFIGSPQMNFIDAGLLGESVATIGVRPEHLELTTNAGNLECVVAHVEHLGSDTNIYVATTSGVQLTARVFGVADYAPGTRVFASASVANRHRFDEQGNRVA